MTSMGIPVSPMDNSSLGVGLVYTIEGYHIPDVEGLNSGGDINVMGDKECLIGG